ncbi:MAG: hypothetical protein WCK90_04070 [archaeon]
MIDFTKLNKKFLEPEKAKGCVILIPGMSGSPLNDERYDKIEKALLGKGYAFLRIEFWNNPKELNNLSLQELFDAIDQAVAFARRKYNKVIGLGKSFGGGLLTAHHEGFDSLMLLSPAFRFGENETISILKNVPFSQIESLAKLVVDKKLLNDMPKTLIIHGTSDSVVSIDNSRKMAKSASNCKLIELQGQDHSYTQENGMEQVVENILSFLV